MIEQALTLGGRPFSCRVHLEPDSSGIESLPLIVALHGGTYTSGYFDIPGYSLLGRAAALGLPIVALDRPGYGKTPIESINETTHASNAAILDAALSDLWTRHGDGRVGIVIIGHSIGGAIALRIAARVPHWPLLGVAVSGIGMTNAPRGAGNRAGLPESPFITMPQAVKDAQMFGPPGTFSADMPKESRAADAPAPRPELLDIALDWPRHAAGILAGIEVPIHYRQAAYDNLWVVDQDEKTAFVTACSAAPRIDAAIVDNAGHCIDFHQVGASFQLEQLAFALRCACRHVTERSRDG